MGLFSGITKVISKAVGSITGGDVLSAGASLLGGVLGNQASAQQAQNQMDFQQYNSNTAYQRAMADMRVAGLNPMLAYQQGGASTPSGASAMQNDVITPALTTAAHLKRTAAEVDNMEKTNQNLDAENDRIHSDTALNKQLKIKAAADAALSSSTAKKVAVDTVQKAAELPVVKADAAARSSWAARQLNHFDRIMESAGHLNPFISSAKTKHSFDQ